MALENQIENLEAKLDTVLAKLQAIENKPVRPYRTPLPDFCKEQKISRPTCYAWADRGLIQLEKIGGRQFVIGDSITVRRYQRNHE